MLNLYAEHIVSFAEGRTVICRGNNWEEVELDENIKINNINRWLMAHKLALNYEKTVHITFSIYKNKEPSNFRILIDELQ